jgi:PAS domain S-box-containing protein
VDDNETTLYISPRIEDLTGFSPEKWQSESFIWENHIHPDDRESILEADRDTHQSGNRFEEEYRFIRSDGQTIWIKDDILQVCYPFMCGLLFCCVLPLFFL